MIGSNEYKYFQVGVRLPPVEKVKLLEFLKNNMDVFAWSAYEAPGIDPEFICYQLNVSHSAMPKMQPPQCSSREHAEAVKEEVNKL